MRHTIDQVLQQAIAHHQAGQLQEAEGLYRAILGTQVHHPDANHNLGMLALQMNQAAAALPHFKIALEANPAQEQYWLSYLDALIQAGSHDKARQLIGACEQRGLAGDALEALVLRLDTHHPGPQAMATLVALFAAARYAEAEALARTMTARFPQHGLAWKVLGVALMEMGRVDEALPPMQEAAALSPQDSEAHNNLGNALHALGRFDQAEASCRLALAIRPDFAEAHNNLSNALFALDRPEEAEASCQQALAIRPDLFAAHNNLGNVLYRLGRLDEAERRFRRALELKPDYADARYNLCNILSALGRPEEAVTSYRLAIQLKPDYAELHNNLGTTLQQLGRLDEAMMSYRLAIQIKPGFAVAHKNLAIVLNNLANTRKEQSLYFEALQAIIEALRIEETAETKRTFCFCIKQIRFTHIGSETKTHLVRAITEPWGRPSELTQVSIGLVKLDPEIGACISRANAAWPRALNAQQLYGTHGDDGAAQINRPVRLGSDPLLCALLVSDSLCDMPMERFLTMARRVFLDTVTAMPAADSAPAVAGVTQSNTVADAALLFYCALARQCFINEYVFSHTDEEFRKASDLRDRMAAALEAGTPVPALWPVVVAAYFPLHALAPAARLLQTPWPVPIESVLTQQLREPETERQLNASITRLTEIDDAVSLRVQNQYEQNPYPRWINIAPNDKPQPVGVVLRQLLPLAPIVGSAHYDKPDILVAGCGTGHLSIDTAQTYRGARVLAVDLSRSSLCYAQRKTLELGLTSIEYAQADLLKLGSLDRTFDLIDASGVLHHLADLWAGWLTLLSRLRPGGFMHLGLYSEVARRNVVRVRKLIAQAGHGSSANEIRQFRQVLVDLDKKADFGTTLKLKDFYNTSDCRDLLFHVQEHRLTLTDIDAFLRANALVFLGFKVDAEVLRAYKRRFPDDRAATNLAQWQSFENENPDTFIGMYQFVIQKAAG